MKETENDRYQEAGTKADAGKAPLDLIPWESVLGAARVFGFGAKKYAPYNWHGLSKSRLFAATLRHLMSWWRGEDLDDETGEPHLYHAACCILMLASHHGIDDRPGLLSDDEWADAHAVPERVAYAVGDPCDHARCGEQAPPAFEYERMDDESYTRYEQAMDYEAKARALGNQDFPPILPSTVGDVPDAIARRYRNRGGEA